MTQHGLLGRAAYVRGEDYVVQREKRIVRRDGMGFKNIEGGARYPPSAERVHYGGGFHYAGVGAVDQVGVRLHSGDASRVYQADSFGGGRNVDADEIGLRHQVSQFRQLHSGRRMRQVRVISDDLHAQGGAHGGQFRAYGSQSHDAHDAPADFDPAHGYVRFSRVLPTVGRRVSVRFGNAASEGQGQRQRVFGYGAGVPAGRIDDQDSAPGSGFDVNLVGRSAADADEFQPARLFDGVLEQEVSLYDEQAYAVFGDAARQVVGVPDAARVQPTLMLDSHFGG